MYPLLINLNVIVIFLIFAQFSNSFNVYVIDTKGHIGRLNEPIHIDAERTPKHTRHRFERQLAEFLLSKKQQHNGIKRILDKDKADKIARSDWSEFVLNTSPVVFSTGRYILDLDKMDVNSEKDDPSKPENANGQFSTTKNVRDYKFFMKVNNRPQPVHNTKSKRHHSLRKFYIKSNTGEDASSLEYITILRNGKKSYVKRFRIVDNSSKKKKKNKKKMKKKIVSSSEWDNSKSSEEASNKKRKKLTAKFSSEKDNSMSSKEIDNSFSAEKKKLSSEESYEYDEDMVYLQGNELVQFKHNDDNTKRSHLEAIDGRRRLPHFLPKRYHWTPDETKHLGYFWFNGPKGKYPEATPL